MEYNFAAKMVFIPTADGNAKDANPAKIHIKALTTEQRNRLTRMEVDSEGELRAVPDMKGIFSAGVERIENLRVNGQDVTTVRAFLEQPRLYAMFTEIAAAILTFSQRDDEDTLGN